MNPEPKAPPEREASVASRRQGPMSPGKCRFGLGYMRLGFCRVVPDLDHHGTCYEGARIRVLATFGLQI